MSSNLVIVAIPDQDDRVWKISSEKIPHLTLLSLGDADKVPNLDQIMLFVEHAASTSLKRFYLPVDHRGELGDDKADVLFFKKGRYDFAAVRDFRSLLLKDTNIKTAYDSTRQFEAPKTAGQAGQPWIPHLTLGYPTSPAKTLPEGDFPNFYDVSFNRIAVWTGDFEGPEFLLKDYWDEFDETAIPMDVAMSDLQHYGVKGMKWGQSKSPEQQLASRERKEIRLDKRRTEGAKTVRVGTSKQDFEAARKDAKWLKRDVNPNNLFAMGKTDKKVFNDANKAMKPEVKALNQKPEYSSKAAKREIKAQIGSTYEKYDREHAQLFIRHMKVAAEKHKTVSPSGKWEDDLKISKDGAWTIGIKRTKDAKHADMSDMDFVIRVLPIRDEDGYIIDYKMLETEDSLTQTTELGEEFLAHLSEEPWSNFAKADYTLEQWHAACLIHTHDEDPTSKSECKLPVKTPDGALNRNGVHAAAAALAGARGGLKGVSDDQKKKAAGALRRYYAQLDEDPPESLVQSAVDLGSEFILEHFGVKGMHWGQRKAPPTAVSTSSTSVVPHGTKRKTKIQVEGGENHPAHDDAIRVAEAKAKLKKSGTSALSNQELREMANRLQLENQVALLTSSKGKQFVSREFETTSKQLIKRGTKQGAKRYGPTVVKKAGKAAATAATIAVL